MMQNFVSKLNPTDVLFGRGSGPNDHEGNVRFRQLVADRKSQYMATNHRLTKTKIAREIVQLVLTGNGRFLRRVETKELEEMGLSEGTECYELVDDDTIMEKAKQALRQNAAKTREELDCGGTTVATGVSTSAVAPAVAAAAASNHSMPLSQQHQQQQHLNQQQQAYARTNNNEPSLSSMSSMYDLEPLPLRSGSGSSFNTSGGIMLDPRIQSQMVSSSSLNNQNFSANICGGWDMVSNTISNNALSIAQQHQQQQQQQQHMQFQTQPATNINYGSVVSEEQNHFRSNIIPQHQQQQQIFYAPNQLHAQQQVPLQNLQYPQQHEVQFQTAAEPARLHTVPLGIRMSATGMDASQFNLSEMNNDSEEFDSRRSSMTMSDLMKIHMKDHKHKIQHQGQLPQTPQQRPPNHVDEIMDSFSQMRTGSGSGSSQESEHRKMMASTETMGTIEAMGSVADVSMATMGSSIFSVFKGGDSLAVLDEEEPLNMKSSPAADNVSSTLGGITPESGRGGSKNQYESTTSLTFAEALFDTNRRTSSSLSASINGMLSDVRRQVESEYPSTVSLLPRSVATLEKSPDDLAIATMGASSLSMLKSAFTEEDESEHDDVFILPQSSD